jgi:hypothetical protein
MIHEFAKSPVSPLLIIPAYNDIRYFRGVPDHGSHRSNGHKAVFCRFVGIRFVCPDKGFREYGIAGSPYQLISHVNAQHEKHPADNPEFSCSLFPARYSFGFHGFRPE